MIVLKFGGTSVGSGERIRGVARIVLDHADQRPVVVTSAMSGVTDALLTLAGAAASGDTAALKHGLADLERRHREAAQAIDPDADWSVLADLLTRLAAALADRAGTDETRDALASFGERLAVTLVAGALRRLGGQALAWDRPIIVTDARFGAATPDMRATRRLAREALATARDNVLVAPGFIGQTPDGRGTTLGRGGSDYSATLLAAALGAVACWIYTDVDGVYTADPRVVRDARVLPAVSDATAGRLAMSGAKVLHPRSVAPAARYGIELRVRNTFRPDHPGTAIAPPSAITHGLPLAVAGRAALTALALTGPGLAEIPNLFGRLCAAASEAGTEIIQAALPVPGHDPQVMLDTEHALAAAQRVAAEFASERAQGHVRGVGCRDGLALCTLVGDDLPATVLLAAQRALAGERIMPLSQSANADALSFVVPAASLTAAIRALHRDVIIPALLAAEQRPARPYPAGQWAAGGRPQRHRRAGAPQH